MLTNPVLISVVMMLALSFIRVNVVLALIVAAITGGLIAGIDLQTTIATFEQGLGDGAQIALSYALLGAFAVAIAHSGLTDYLASMIIKKVVGHNDEGKAGVLRWIILASVVLMAISSQNIVPVHIAFIPILIPPLVAVFDRLEIDRRAVACCITFGLVTTYMFLPVGFGSIFINQLLHRNLVDNGLIINATELPTAMAIPALGMVFGLIIAVFVSYRKPRVYAKKSNTVATPEKSTLVPSNIIVSALAVAASLAIQLYSNSIIMGALSGFVMLMLVTRANSNTAQDLFVQGVKMMAMIGFIMISAAGFANVMRETGGIPELVNAATAILGNNLYLAAAMMLIVGLLITMGIGSSFSTIPIIAAIYVPLCIELGFSPLAIAALVGTAAALGDAGSPASDSTLGPTAGLNIDGQHDHISGTVIPTFLHFNIPLLVAGWLAAVVL
ncbi:TRAP transporter large permease subunit [Alginatibacterium sediminis]|uniref:TRAP transporter large permease subunit n=1 Tax=Alginatibacterium sediminis TaxID=2164068 RepID=A0A420EGW6_9ALTE|nr:Na+/H+ antiporter NhaC family protein [Alginatibacterium sediminis]RKF19923.1 TRAP transporter large permease subunit [Alginatibacterium sediminis]